MTQISNRVRLPRSVRPPFQVFRDGVPQRKGEHYEVEGSQLVFAEPLVDEGKLSFWAWALGSIGVGTYKRNDSVDVRYELEGRPRVARQLPLVEEE